MGLLIRVPDSKKRPKADMYCTVHVIKLKTEMVVVEMMMMIHHCIVKVAVSSSPPLQSSSQFQPFATNCNYFVVYETVVPYKNQFVALINRI